MKGAKIKKSVREAYGKIARDGRGGCSCGCGSAKFISKGVGYTDNDIEQVPKGANLGLGCGNPVALATLKPGETVLDLGSGGGFDCFLSSKKVGKSGKVIGVDMTPDMLALANSNKKKGGYDNVEFRRGEIENLPVESETVDAVISNCVINLSPDKDVVFRDIHRVLKPGGRFMVSDIVLTMPLPKKLRSSVAAYIGCIAGAVSKDEYMKSIFKAGFVKADIIGETPFPIDYVMDIPGISETIKKLGLSKDEQKKLFNSVVSIKVHGKK